MSITVVVEEKSQVVHWSEGVLGEVIEETDEYLAIYRIGRSVYRDAISGTTYEPAKIIFARIVEKGPRFYHIEELMRVPVRRR